MCMTLMMRMMQCRSCLAHVFIKPCQYAFVVKLHLCCAEGGCVPKTGLARLRPVEGWAASPEP